MLPAGACALSTFPLVAAGKVGVGDCVQTVSGREQVVSVGKVEGKGIYTVIAMEELIVVNGIVATPFGGVNPTLANWYYNLHRLTYYIHVMSSSRGKTTTTYNDIRAGIRGDSKNDGVGVGGGNADAAVNTTTTTALVSASSFSSLLSWLKILPDMNKVWSLMTHR